MNFKNKIRNFKKNNFIVKKDISALKREDFGTPELIRKYFTNKGVELDRFHLPEITAEEYEAIALQFLKSPKFNKVNLKFDTASDFYKRRARLVMLANDMHLDVNMLNAYNYIWDERYYLCPTLTENIMLVDEWYRYEKNDDERYCTANDAYIKFDYAQSTLNVELWDMLWSFCMQALKLHKVMLLGEIENCISSLIGILESTDGFHKNTSAVQNATMMKFFKHFDALLSDAEGQKWITENDDFTVFGDCPETHNDLLRTYAKIFNILLRSNSILDRFDMLPLIETGDEYKDRYVKDILDFETPIITALTKC